MQQNNYIVGRAFRHFMLAAILTSIVQQLRIIVDGMMVGHFVGAMALSAINLYLPLEDTVYAVIMLFISGAGFVAAQRQSRHDYEGVSRQFTLAVVSASAAVLVLLAWCFCCFPTLINLLSDASVPELYDLTASYTFLMLFTFIIQVPNSVLRTFISLDGQPQLVTRSIIVSFLLNIVLDLFFIYFFQLGMRGAAVATLVSDTVGMCVLLPYAIRSHTFGFVRLKGVWSEMCVSLKAGVPMGIGDLLVGIVMLCVNQIVLYFQGANGAFIFAIVFPLLSLFGMLNEGLSDIHETIGGVLLGEKNNTQFRTLIGKSYRLIWSALVVFTTIVLLFPSFFLSLFGADESQLTPDNCMALRVGVLMFIPAALTTFHLNVHVLVGHGGLTSVMSVLQALSLVATPFLVTAVDVNLFWWSLPLGALITIAIQLMLAYSVHRRNPDTTSFLLLPTLPDCVSMDYSISYQDENLDTSLKDAALFLNVCELDESMRVDAFVCCTDIAYNILQNSSDNRENHYFDMRIMDNDNSIDIWFKDAGKPYNPAHEIAYPEGMQIDHKYMFGLNVTTLIIKK